MYFIEFHKSSHPFFRTRVPIGDVFSAPHGLVVKRESDFSLRVRTFRGARPSFCPTTLRLFSLLPRDVND